MRGGDGLKIHARYEISLFLVLFFFSPVYYDDEMPARLEFRVTIEKLLRFIM